MSSPQPFQIAVPQHKLDTLRDKLSHAEFPDEPALPEHGDKAKAGEWDIGCPRAEVERLAHAWARWDWRVAERRLNEVPQFQVDVDVHGFGGLKIHFVHQRSEAPAAIPLLFVHGWPGSFIEVLKILPLLSQHHGDGPTFHVVAPSLPNFGFSQGVSRRGFGLAQYAETCHKLMQRLGYTQYVTQGGDWGYLITRVIGIQYPESCKASHVNMMLAAAPTFRKNPLLALQHAVRPYTENERKGLERTEWFTKQGCGYNLLQSTKPQTLAYALHDSPVALLSWIYEKLHDWTDAYPWTDDEIFTWISIYRFSRAGPGAAHRIYYEATHPKTNTPNTDGRVFTHDDVMRYTPNVKLGITYNPKELLVEPKIWARTLGDVVFESENDRGGHFYAYELPNLLVKDVKSMFGKGGGAYGLIQGKDGYKNNATARL